MEIAAASPIPGLAVLFAVGVTMYLLPTIIASHRGVSNVGTIAVLNIFFGWSVVGWILGLAWACKSVKPPTVQVVYGPPPLSTYQYPPHPQ
jgi:hypothetical protein